MYFIELTDYTMMPPGNKTGLNLFHLAVSEGDVCSIRSDSWEDAHLLIRALSTLIAPSKGVYRFKGEKLDFSDYRKLLPIKKKIGFIAPEAAMISNRTIRENLLLIRYYFENSLSISLDDYTFRLCERFRIVDKLDMRPAALDPADLRIAITIREVTKLPELLLVEKPEDFIGQKNFTLFIEVFEEFCMSKVPIVFFSNNNHFIRRFSNREIVIKKQQVTAKVAG
jgi:ABC-type lipoprotein export system ATPase subunit